MKILVISTPVFAVNAPNGCVGYAGLEVIAWHCAKGLAEKGHEVSLVAPDGSDCPNVEIMPIGQPGQVDEFAAYDRYWSELPKFDCVLDHSWAKCAHLLKGEGRLKAPVLGVMHAPVSTMYQTLPPNVEKPCFVCISEDQANAFRDKFSRPVRVCRNGADVDFYRPLNVPRTDRFLFLARFSTIKGPDLAIAACREAGVGLDLIGDFSITNEPEFLEKCLRSCDGKQIRLVGPANRGECVWWYSQAKAMLHLNQRFREPFGLAPVEAMLCGLPVIAWDHGAMRETVPHGSTSFEHDPPGRLVNSMQDAIEAVRFFRDYPVHPNGRVLLRDWASQFSIENMINGYERLCVEAVETGGW